MREYTICLRCITITWRLFIASVIVLSLPSAGFSQFSISGKVINQADTKPIADCSVFINNAANGTKTAADGNFELRGLKPGKYTVVFSFVGYDTYSQEVAIADKNIVLPDITLYQKTIALGLVTIKPDANRERNLAWFKEAFLGTSELAKECKILNPDIIDLSYDEHEGLLTASSTDFLVIDNQALGYRIKYLLTDFALKNKDGEANEMHYYGSVLFENIKGSQAQERRWQKRREEVYANSSMHFLRALLPNRLAADGFRATQIAVYQNSDRPADSVISGMIKKYKKLKDDDAKWRDSLSFWNAKLKLPKILQKEMQFPLVAKDLVHATDMQGILALSCEYDKLRIDYDKNARFTANGARNTGTTIATFNSPYAFFDASGGITNPAAVSFAGAWGRNRIAELLPIDFEPAGSTAKQLIVKQAGAANTSPLNASLLKFVTVSDSLNKKAAIEKLYIQLDKPYYALNDTLWFKGYLLNTSYLAPSAKSGFIYADVMNDSSKAVQHFKFPAENGLTWGSIGLSDKDFTPGPYTLRVYTRWMRNYGDDCFFTKQFYISSAGENTLLVNANVNVKPGDKTDTASVKLMLSNINKTAYAVKSMHLQVMDGNKRLDNKKILTGVDGAVDFKFAIPAKAPDLAIVLTGEKNDKKAVIPVTLNRPQNCDIQFLPEGGELVAGLPAHIGFKAVSEDGKGTDISGTIINQEQKQVAEFRSTHNGMGSFDLPVKAGESYTAKVLLAGGVTRLVALPAVKSSGIVLNARNEVGKDSVEVTIKASADIVATGNSYFLTGSARGIVCYAAVVNFPAGKGLVTKVAKSLFPAGVARFTLMTTEGKPLNERALFINTTEKLNVSVNAAKAVYATRDSIALKIRVSDANGKPVNGNFSMAVTDDAQVKTDSFNTENILSRFLLTSDLKGTVEGPGYYLPAEKPGVWQALDNLLLTQGWVSYDVSQPAKFEPETEFAINGRIANVFNKAVKQSKVMLFSKSPTILRDTMTDKDGRFRFASFPRIDTPVFMIKAVNKSGNSFNVAVNVDEVPPPAFDISKQMVMQPWYLNTDTVLLNYTKTNKLVTEQEYTPNGGHILKEVKITAKKFINDSKNLNGPGNADQVIDEKEIEKQGKKTLLDLLQEKVKGFTVRYGYGHQYYCVDGIFAFFLVDGVEFYSVLRENPEDFLKSQTAEDIKGIEVNISSKNSNIYYRRYCPLCNAFTLAFIDITTRSGNGLAAANTPGMYLYKPLAVSWPKQYYKPAYTIKGSINQLPDLRSTIDWEPNINTNENGEASVSFYSAGKPSTYTVILEGTDLNGSFGRTVKKIKVNAGSP